MSPLLLAVALLAASTAHASPVQLVQQEGSWSLTRNGQPFELRGVGGEQELPLLVDIGGTSFRTWGVGEGTLALLDEAHALSRIGIQDQCFILLQYQRVLNFDVIDKITRAVKNSHCDDEKIYTDGNQHVILIPNHASVFG